MNKAAKKNKFTHVAKNFLTVCFVLLAITSLSTLADDAFSPSSITALNFASTDWCPYTCSDPEQPGFVTEAMTQALANYDISLSVTILPWTRAIKMSEQGAFDGLIIALPSEVPGFHLTENPSGMNNICLFSLPDSSYMYKNRKSLSGMILGAIQDYSYGKPIDDIINSPNEDEQVYFLANSKPLHSLVEMTYIKRIDTFAEDQFVLGNCLKNHKNRLLKNIGCLEKAPLFTSFSPNYKKYKEAIALLNKILGSEEYKLLYNQAQQRYIAP